MSKAVGACRAEWDRIAMALITVVVSAVVLGAYHGTAPRFAGDSQVWLENGYVPDFGTLLLGKRPFFVPLVHRLLSFDQEIVCWTQAAVQLACWALFARELSLFVRFRAARVGVFGAVLCWLALEPNDWAFTVRSESLSHALLFAFLGGLLGFVRADSVGRTRAAYGWALLLAPLAFAFAGTRDTIAYLLFGAAVTVSVAAWVAKRSRRRLAASLVLGATLLSVGVVSERLTERSGRHHLPLINVVLGRILTNQAKLAYFRDELELPVTSALLKRQKTSFSSDDWVVVRDPKFAKFNQWVAEQGHAKYQRYLLSHKALTVREAYPWFERLARADYGKSYLAKPRVRTLAKVRVARRLVDPIWLLPKSTWLVLAFGAVAGAAFAKRREVRGLAVVLGFCCVSAVALTFIGFHGDAMEVSRHGAIVGVLLQVILCLGLTLAVIGLGEVWVRRRGTRRGSSRGVGAFGPRSYAAHRVWRAGVWGVSAVVLVGMTVAAAHPRVRPNRAPGGTLSANPPRGSVDALVDGDLDGERLCLKARGDELVLTLPEEARVSAAYVFHGTTDERKAAYVLTAEQKHGHPRTRRVDPDEHWATPFQGNKNVRRLVLKNLGDELCISEITAY